MYNAVSVVVFHFLGIVALLLSHMLSVASLYLWLLDVGSWSVIRVLVALLLASS